MEYEIWKLTDHPELLQSAARWFHEKWGIPYEAYLASMEDALAEKSAVPQWYLAVAGTRIVGGMGVIENDFHNRPDLAPNVCAVYTEEDCRGHGICGALLRFVCGDMETRGVDTLYLVTDHVGFYERYGWEFYCMVRGEDGAESRMYVHRTREIRYVREEDKDFWYSLDRHLPEGEFARKVRDKQGYVLLEKGQPVGILRYNLFWDNTPFCTLLYVADAQQRRGHGRALMAHWEAEMKAQGYGMVLTSTQADETAQHFYRKLGYRDCGGLTPTVPGYEQPMELFLCKAL